MGAVSSRSHFACYILRIYQHIRVNMTAVKYHGGRNYKIRPTIVSNYFRLLRPRFQPNSNPLPALSHSHAIDNAFQPAAASVGDGGTPSIAEKPAALHRPCGDVRHCGRLFQPCAGFRLRPHSLRPMPCDGAPFGHHAGAAPPSFMICLGGTHIRRDTLHVVRGCVAPPLGRMRPLGGHPDVAGLPECRITFVSSSSGHYFYLRRVGRVPHDIANRERAETQAERERTTHAVGH